MKKEFFEKVLPHTQGNICVLGIKKISDSNGNKRDMAVPKFFETLDEAMEQMQSFDNDPEFNTFCAMGKFEGLRRKAVGCIALRSLFVDLDCGEPWIDKNGKEHKKPYLTQAEALTALDAFLTNTGMPQPIVVNSGKGIHAYWPLTDDVLVADWVPLAELFMEFCLGNGLPLDTDVTADAARVLRAPGSIHKKGTPIQTSILHDVEPIDLAEITAIIGIPEKKFSFDDVQKGLDPDTQAMYDKLNGNYEFIFEDLAIASLEGNGCGQIKEIITNAAGCPEPLWYAGLSVAIRCVDGDTAIHKISEDHPEYTFDETERKAHQSLREAKWAHGCDAFAKENPDGCDGCPHRARIGKAGPIMLARRLKLAEEPAETDAEPSEEGEVRADQSAKDLVRFPDFLNPYFRPAEGGVYFQPMPRMVKGKRIQDDPEMLTPHDFYPVQRLYSPSDGECMLMRLKLPRDKPREFLLPNKEIPATDRLKSVLAAQGVVFEPTNAPKLASYLMKWTNFLMNTQKADIMRHQQGWTEEHEAFVLGTKEIHKDEIRNSPPSPVSRSVVKHIKTSGTFDGWLQAARMFGDPGYEFHAFAMLCGFATPLVEFTSINGVVLSLYGESGTGKTGALYGAMSIWGSPEDLCVNDGTQNALTQRMITSKNLPFGLDEQSNLDGKTASDVVYKTSAGRPKIRMQASVNSERETEFVTRLISIMTTNTSLPDLISTYKANTTAEEMRILEPTITRPSVPGYELNHERGLAMFDSLKTHYGHAGVPYIQHLLQHGAHSLRNLCHVESLRMAERFTTNAEFRFLTNLYAVVSVAYHMTHELGWFDWDIERIFRVVGMDLERFIARKKHMDNDSREDVLGDFIGKYIQNVLVINDGNVTMSPRGSLYIRAEVDTGLLFVSSTAMREYLQSIRMGTKDFEGRMTRAGMLVGKVRKKMAVGWNEAVGATNVQAYVIQTDLSDILPNLGNNDAQETDGTSTGE